ncbi:Putative serine/threonine-protein kinase F31E3.2 [Melipona quadrifasciata]|uniref:Putative serine/threonine-protein kinase F31E3.2 n=1 Tax=Melipona quadrifasciata TaxID=166423 RepID=A0A0N0BEB5_9HYME|nr:Putative serine/threonine-protein kinase F31E3.2 [Melipona quadrifasciata]
MGNSTSKNNYHNNQKYTSQYSLSDIIGGSCIGSTQSSQKETKSWSRASCRSWSEGTLYDPLGTSKTLWPVSRSQAMFLPEFQIRQVSLQNSYTFFSVIAKGAYGKVYKIQKRDTGQLFALKVISKAKVVAENGIMQAKQEVSIQKLVGHHPFILDCSHRWQGRKTLYILTDYIGGGELFSLIEQCGFLPENIVRIYVAEVALAIDFLHNAGVVHRDIKATNVLLDEEGHAVIIDFGLAKWLNHAERTNTLCGTPEYMGKEYYGQEVDWWSLGVLACFMLTNQGLELKKANERISLDRCKIPCALTFSPGPLTWRILTVYKAYVLGRVNFSYGLLMNRRIVSRRNVAVPDSITIPFANHETHANLRFLCKCILDRHSGSYSFQQLICRDNK